MLIRALQDIRIHIIWCVLNEIYTRKEQEGTKGTEPSASRPLQSEQQLKLLVSEDKAEQWLSELQTLRSTASSCPRLHLLTNSPEVHLSTKHAKCSVYYHGRQQAPLWVRQTAMPRSFRINTTFSGDYVRWRGQPVSVATYCECAKNSNLKSAMSD